MVVHKRCVKQPMHVIANISLYKYAKKKKNICDWMRHEDYSTV